jgi:uncharacterized protein (DUF924 family)
MLPDRARALIDFWFGPPGDPEREQFRPIWFQATAEHDDTLRHLFLGDYEAGAAGRLAAWEAAADSALALLLLLDQIPRNIFRDTPGAYVTDAAARAVADRVIARGFDMQVPAAWRMFFYMPFHHIEDLADQRRAEALTAPLRLDRDPERGSHRRYGMSYPDVIARFGRFPHRNTILGRPSTPEEAQFLAEAERRHREQSEATS